MTLRFTAVLVLAALAAVFAVPGHAQDSEAENALVSAFAAEHQAWKEDISRWKKEHDAAVRALQDALTRIQQEGALEQHSTRINEHHTALDGALAGLAGHHARVRSHHEEMREVHHHLMDAIASIVKATEADLGVIGETAPAATSSDSED